MPFFRLWSRKRPLASLAYVMPLVAAIGCGGGKKPAADPSSTEEKSSGGGGGPHSGPAAVGHPAPDLSMQTVNGKGKESHPFTLKRVKA